MTTTAKNAYGRLHTGWSMVFVSLAIIASWSVLAAPQINPEELKISPSELRSKYFTSHNYARAEQLYGSAGRKRLEQWQQLLELGGSWPESEKLHRVNQFFNQITFVSDQQHWGEDDFWATPVELLGTNGGDCEDFSIAKARTLVTLGVPRSRLRLVYAKALSLNQAHMVLGYYATPSSIPLLLDNINPEILAADRRQDLVPIYSFSLDGQWEAKAQGRGRQFDDDINKVNKVNDLIRRLENMEMRSTEKSTRKPPSSG